MIVLWRMWRIAYFGFGHTHSSNAVGSCSLICRFTNDDTLSSSSFMLIRAAMPGIRVAVCSAPLF
jgi:hypothetical protein